MTVPAPPTTALAADGEAAGAVAALLDQAEHAGQAGHPVLVLKVGALVRVVDDAGVVLVTADPGEDVAVVAEITVSLDELRDAAALAAEDQGPAGG